MGSADALRFELKSDFNSELFTEVFVYGDQIPSERCTANDFKRPINKMLSMLIAAQLDRYPLSNQPAQAEPVAGTEGIWSVPPHETSLSSAEPTLTPCKSPDAITPEEITTRFWDSSLESYDKSSYLASLRGVCVEWTLRFWSAEQMNTVTDEMLLSLTSQASLVHVYLRIPYKTHERFPLLGHDRRVHVKGQIKRVDGQGGIELTNAAVDVVK